MATFTQLPGELDIVVAAGDQVALALDFDRDITGYTLSSAVYVATQTVPTTGGAAQPTAGATVFAPVISIASATAGTVTVNMTKTQTAMLSPVGRYRWFVRWASDGEDRTILSGKITTKVP